MSSTEYSIVILGSYLLGSIPFGLLFMKLAGLGDVRKTGSGNIGATNVLRNGGKSLGLVTFLADAGKGALAVYLAQHFLHLEAASLAAFVVTVGHIFPIWLGFRGGKGVATAFGVLFMLSWKIGLICLVIWLGVAYLTRYSSVASLFAMGFAPLFALRMTHTEVLLALGGITLLIYIRHLGNISRLVSGEEPKILSGKTS